MFVINPPKKKSHKTSLFHITLDDDDWTAAQHLVDSNKNFFKHEDASLVGRWVSEMCSYENQMVGDCIIS